MRTRPMASSAYPRPVMIPWTRTKLGIDTAGPLLQSVHGGTEEHRSQQVRALVEVGGQSVETDLAAFDEDGPLGQAHGAVDALLHEYHRRPLAVDLADDVHESVHRLRRQP